MGSPRVPCVLFDSKVNRNCSCFGYIVERDKSLLPFRFQLEQLDEWLHNEIGIFANGPNLDYPRALL